jgi:hypothetical protein
VETRNSEQFVADVDANYGGTLLGVFIFGYTIKAGEPGRIELQAEVSDIWGTGRRQWCFH